jgi:hypothetical protein
MRTIVISTEVFAALWARRKPGEDSENAILERMLGLPRGPALQPQLAMMRTPRPAPAGDGQGGIVNARFGVHFPAGFEIFRTYKGKTHRATVQGGHWVMNGLRYPSLYALSVEVVDSNENPWVHWKYRDAEGREDLISALRRAGPVTAPLPPPERPAPKKKTARKKKAR